MVITKTPFRISFFGGGTDMEKHFAEYGGSVISTSIDKYCYVTARKLPKFFDYDTELAYSQIERVHETREIKHPAIRNAMTFTNTNHIRLTYEADLPARSGLGTSSSFAVGMLNAFHAMQGTYLSKKQLADEAIYLERVLCQESGGWQDQIAAAFGGLNRINFLKEERRYEVKPLLLSPNTIHSLQDHLLLVFTGISRFSSKILQENHPEDKTKMLLAMQQLTDEAETVLRAGNVPEIGRLLDETWRIKRNTGKSVSSDAIDNLYETGKKAGATGGKILGAGGGGFFLFFVEPDKRSRVISALGNCLVVPMRFETEGTQIIFER